MEYHDITATFLIRRFPRLKTKIANLQNSWHGEDLSPYTLFYYGIFEDIVSLLEQKKYIEIQRYFDFTEELVCNAKSSVKDTRTGNDIENLVQTGFLEYFWDTAELYYLARQHMGYETGKLFSFIGTYLNIPER